MKKKLFCLTAICVIIYSAVVGQALLTKKVTTADVLSRLSDGHHFLLTGKVIAKLDDQLNTVWSRQISDTTFNPGGSSIYFKHGVELPDNSIVVCGFEFHGLYCYGLLVKLDQDGNLKWVKTYLREGPHSGMQPDHIAQLPNGDLVMLGRSGAGAGPDKILWMKTDTAGNILGYREIFSLKDYTAVDIFPLADNSTVIACYYGNIGVTSDNAFPRMLHSDVNGHVTQWVGYGFTFGSSMTDCIQVDGGYLISGMSTNASYIMKVDSAFDFLWKKTYPDSIVADTSDNKNNAFQALTKLDDGSYLLSGTFPGPDSSLIPFYMKTDSSGNVIFANTLTSIPGFTNDCVNFDHPIILGQTPAYGSVLFDIDLDGTSACPDSAVPMTAASDDLIFTRDSAHTVESISASLLNHSYTIVDFGSDSVLCEQTFQEIQTVKDVSSVSLYPNPANDQITIQLPSDAAGSMLFIYDVDGKEIFHQDIFSATPFRIETNLLPAGIYEILIRKADGNFASAKFMVER